MAATTAEPGVPGVRSVRRVDGAHEVSLAEGSDPAAVIHRLAGAVPAARIEMRRPSLEDVFIETVQDTEEVDARTLRASLRDDPELLEPSP